MAKKAISTKGLNETLAALEAVTNITSVSKAAVYAGAGVVIDTMKEEISTLQVTRYYGTEQKMPLTKLSILRSDLMDIMKPIMVSDILFRFWPTQSIMARPSCIDSHLLIIR